MTSNKIIEKSEVREYFNGTGFERWNKIYSKSDEINTVQKNIRKGHQKTVDDVVSYIKNYPEPEPQKKNIVFPDILFVPMVAFDCNLLRLGYGGGYYDRYIEKINKKKSFLSVGLAFDSQKMKKIPFDKFDKSLDIIITEKKIYK